MFTGLIEANGEVAEVSEQAGARRLRVATPIGAELADGDSIAVNGVCLTVAHRDASGFDADVSPETIRVTTLGSLRRGTLVNLERPLRADARLGGHFVLGHVDGIGRMQAVRPDGDCYWLDVDVPGHVLPWIIPKGSIALDGVSLTVAKLEGTKVGVQVVPHTWMHTAFRMANAGDAVNVEGDVIGKYVARLVGRAGATPGERAGTKWRAD
jgi:riboflavin synthase